MTDTAARLLDVPAEIDEWARQLTIELEEAAKRCIAALPQTPILVMSTSEWDSLNKE
ncbi:hypothetical protein [Pseudarthrobacter sp. SSS035]|uniref:hypothetical protein n=1 Tax=Pseudarthrobacter sp. SSS035 TaxID=2931399 RepID=UPI00200DB194|nr:hypothetical protein [Pseudarthrobacter sp. SSS035]